MTPSKIDPNTPFTQNLLRTLVATLPAQRDETEADYEERFATASAAWAAYRPRDIVEQMLAAQIVAAHYSALDCLARAAEAENQIQADKLRRSHVMMIRSMRDGVRQLDHRQQRPADTEAPPAIPPIPPFRRRPAEANATQDPIQRDKPAAAPKKDISKMTDAELTVAKQAVQVDWARVLFDKQHPLHREAVGMLPEYLPGLVIPDSWFEDAPPMTP